MKRLLLLAMLVLVVVPAVAIQLDYQNAEDYSDLSNITTVSGGGTATYTNNATAGNAYMSFSTTITTGQVYVMYATPEQTTYAAATQMRSGGGTGGVVAMFNSSKGIIGTIWTSSSTGRFELVTDGGSASLYRDGTLVSSQAISANPFYVGFGAYSNAGTAHSAQWDDIAYGSTEDKVVIDMPADGGYYIKKDMVNPASSGLFNASTGNVVFSSSIPYSFSRSALNGLSSVNDSIYLINAQTGTVYATQYTGTSSSRSDNFDIGTYLISAGAPYGWYQIKINNTLSDRIAFIANGANIYFDDDDYSQGDSATVTYLVDSDYWLLGEYTYRIDIIDVYGTVHHTENIATSEGSVSFTWDADEDDQGVYYAEIIADRISDGEDVLLNYDYATLTAYFGFTGNVNAAQTALPIEAANVSYAQGDTVETDSSGFHGNYSVSGFLTGIPIWANVSADGYETQNFTFTVMNGHTITRNITLNETTPSYTGLGIGGVCRDGVFTSPNSITGGYGRPIPSATCYLLNTTHSESYNTTGNNAGGYLFDESGSVFLTSGRVYDLWCQRSGYGNSPNYTVVAA